MPVIRQASAAAAAAGPDDPPISHPHLNDIPQVLALGVCQWVRFDDCPNRPGEPCGIVHNRCAAHKRSRAEERAHTRGDPCGRPAIEGCATCRSHGSSAPQVRAKGQERLTLSRVMGEVGKLLGHCRTEVTGRSEVEALDALRDDAAAMVLATRIMLSDLPERAEADVTVHYDDKGAPHTVVTVEKDGLVGPNSKGELSRHVIEQIHGDWVDRSMRIEKAAADLGLAERRITLDEGKAKAILVVIRGTLAALNIDFDDERVPGIVAGQLRALEVGGAETG